MSLESNWRTALLRLLAASALGLLVTLSAPTSAWSQCVGDCDGVGTVTVDEIVSMVNIALGMANVSTCMAGDSDGGGAITVDEIITATNNALNGCPRVAVCGNGIVGPGEECDDGGVCIGGDNAGAVCDAEEDCQGNGVCDSGIKVFTMCDADDDCPGSKCVHCKPFGGDGCAANCTAEKKIPFNLVAGQMNEAGDNLVDGTSGVVVQSVFLPGIVLPLEGSLALNAGSERNGEVPLAVSAGDIQFPAIPVLSLACACVKGAVPKTCGGLGFLADGVTLSPDCTDEDTCAQEGLPPCTILHGAGNTASGRVGCSSLEGVDLTATLENGDLSINFGGNGGPGSALIFTSIDIGLVLGGCTGTGPEYGADGMFCTPDDPPNDLSAVGTGPLSTGTVCGEIKSETDPLGPFCRTGAPMSCAAISEGAGSVSNSCLSFAIPVTGLPQVGDIVASLSLCAQ